MTDRASFVHADDLLTVTVSFHPEQRALLAQLETLPMECLKVVVDNGSNEIELAFLRQLADRIPNTVLVENAANVGLAAAINQGLRYGLAARDGLRWCLLLDQDTEPESGAVEILLDGIRELQREGDAVGCVGPSLVDVETGLSHGFHQATRFRWRRAYPAPRSRGPIRCTTLNGSGTLMPVSLFKDLGGLDERLFIDHIDTEWSFRVLAAQRTLWGLPQAVFHHRMGERSLRYWLFGWRVMPYRSPPRHRYLFRNTVWLLRRAYVPAVWKFWAVAKLGLTMAAYLAFSKERRQQIAGMLSGLGAGLK